MDSWSVLRERHDPTNRSSKSRKRNHRAHAVPTYKRTTAGWPTHQNKEHLRSPCESGVHSKCLRITAATRPTASSQRTNTKWIKFQWDDRTTVIGDCDTKHFVYLIYRALLSVERKQKKKNKYYVKMGYPNRVLDLLDKEQFITSLLDTEGSRLNGASFVSMSSRAFTNEVLSGINGTHCSLGWAIKIYEKLEAQTRCDGIYGEVAIPNLKYVDLP